MMRKISGLYLLVVAVVFMACNKEPLPILPEENAPIYTLTGDVGSEELKMSAGVNGVIMSHGIGDMNGMETYYGELESILTGDKFRIEFVRQESPFGPDEIRVFNDYSIPFLVHQKGRLVFDFGGVGNQSEYFQLEDEYGYWVGTDVHEMNEFGVIKLKAKFDDFSNATYNLEIKHGFDEFELNSQFVAQGAENVIYLNALEDAPYHQWFINGVLVGDGSSYESEIDDGIYKITHFVKDELGNEASTQTFARIKGGKRFWRMQMKYDENVEFDNNNYGKVIVSMFKDGEWYTSSHSKSNFNKSFGVDSVKQIAPIKSGDISLLAFKFNFESVLLNEDKTDSLVLSGMDGTFSIGLE